MLLHASPSLVLDCINVRTDWRHKYREMKMGVSWHGNSTVKHALAAGNLFKHNLREMLFELKSCTSNNIDIRTFWWSYAEKWHVFPEKIDCWTCAVDWRTVLQWCYGCYSNSAGGSRPIPDFLCKTSRQHLHNLLCLKLSITDCFGKVMPKIGVLWFLERHCVYASTGTCKACGHIFVLCILPLWPWPHGLNTPPWPRHQEDIRM